MDFILSLLNGLPGSVGQGLMWGIMAIGVYITYRVLDIADLTVDGSLATGGAVCVLLTVSGVNVWLATIIAMLDCSTPNAAYRPYSPAYSPSSRSIP